MLLYRKTPPPFPPFSCRHLYVRHWMAPWLVLPAALSIETGCETRFAAMGSSAPQRILPRARAAQTSTLTWGFVVFGSPHWTVTCGRLGVANATPKTREAQAALTHTHLVPSQFHHWNQISNSIKPNQIQSNYIRATRPIATPHGIEDKQDSKMAGRFGTTID